MGMRWSRAHDHHKEWRARTLGWLGIVAVVQVLDGGVRPSDS
jgi:hypothetical protein